MFDFGGDALLPRFRGLSDTHRRSVMPGPAGVATILDRREKGLGWFDFSGVSRPTSPILRRRIHKFKRFGDDCTRWAMGGLACAPSRARCIPSRRRRSVIASRR